MKILVLILSMTISSLAIAELRVLPELKMGDKEKLQLLESAQGALGQPLAETRAFKDDVPIATLVFGPHSVKPMTFSIDLVSCERGDRKKWTCSESVEARFVYVGSVDQSVRYHDGVSSAAAIAIHKEARDHCRMDYQSSFVFKPEIWFSQDEGVYQMYGGNCDFQFEYSDGRATIGKEIYFLE